jgi:predicted anti-sigma-YlaC factor YlaD
MHAVVMESLEDYLAGTLKPAGQRQVEAHLSTCEVCREEVGVQRELSQMLGSLRSEETWAPSPGFYAGVMELVGERKAVPTFASFFALDLAFGRRLVFASLLTLAVLGSYLVSRETGYMPHPTPESVMAQENSATFEGAPAQDNMLVTLTAYEY